MCGKNSRWKKGNIRYTRDIELRLGKYIEERGWYRGAKVRKQATNGN